MAVLVAAESLVLVLLVVLVAGLLRSHADILRALHSLGARVGDTSDEAPGQNVAVAAPRRAEPLPGPGGDDRRLRPVGRPAPDLSGVSPEGEAVAIGVAGSGRDTLVAFLSSGCGTCAGFWQSLAAGAQRALGETRVVVVTRDPSEESASALARLSPGEDVTVVMSSAAWDDYQAPGSPYFVYVDGGRGEIVGEGTASGWDQLMSLCRQACADGATAAAPAPAPAPAPGGSDRWLSGPERELRADRELSAAGIRPGHPSLYPPTAGPLDR